MGKKPISHLEFRTHDVNRLQSFYGELFGWRFDKDGDYTLVDTGNKELTGGIFAIPPNQPEMRPGVSAYITVKDLEAAEARVRELGGHIVVSKHEVPGMGHFSTFVDADGNVMAVWQELGKKAQKKAEKAEKKAEKAEKKADAKAAEPKAEAAKPAAPAAKPAK